MSDAARKPFWKRKRWIAVAVLWLVLAYPLLCGPLRYAVIRGWLPRSSEPLVVWPGLAPSRLPIAGDLFWSYHWWWVALAYEQEGWTVEWSESGVVATKFTLTAPSSTRNASSLD